jgi:hypothetical protein
MGHRPTDTDLPEEVRFLDPAEEPEALEDEAAEPSPNDHDRLQEQVEHERQHGHPALQGGED